jgi:type VI secretion system secreted protein Hcp
MASGAYLRLKGQKQGQIQGGVTQKGREGTIEVHSWTWNLESPRDAATGLATGRVIAGEFFITKEKDKSSPLLLQALASNENLTEWELKLYDPLFSGAEENSFTWKLTNANISSIRTSGLAPPPSGSWGDPEEIAFAFQKLEVTFNSNGAFFQYDQIAP